MNNEEKQTQQELAGQWTSVTSVTSVEQDTSSSPATPVSPNPRRTTHKHPTFVIGTLSLIATSLLYLICMQSLTGKITVLKVNGNSMMPTIQDGETLLGQSNFTPTSGDIYAVRDPEGNLCIKRLIGIPHDKVALVDGDTYVNDTLVQVRTSNSWDNLTIALGEDEYYFLGDNREASIDSRFWSTTTIGRADILCNAKLRVAPFYKYGKVE